MKKIYLVMIALGVFVLGIQQALACSCMMPGTPLEEMKKSNHVYVAEITDIATKNNSLVVDINMLESFKGSKDIKQIQTASNSAACGVHFQKGEKWLIYETSQDDKHQVYACSRTKKLEYATEDLQALSKGKTQYTSQKIFEMVEGPTCKTATDGCNTLGLENGKITITTEAYCHEHTPLYECNVRTIKPKTYKTKKDLLAAHPDCKNATDGVNSFFGKDLMLGTRMGYPENFVAEWSCLDKEAAVDEPRICTMEYAPVCGENGVTYGNSCQAGSASIAYDGECKKNGLSAQENAALKKLETKIAKKYVQLIDKVVKKYENRLLVHSNTTIVEGIHSKIMKRIAEKKKKAVKNSKLYMLLEYLELKLKTVEDMLHIKNTTNVQSCDSADGTTQCKK